MEKYKSGPRNKHPAEKIAEIKELFEMGLNPRVVSKMVKVPYSTIYAFSRAYKNGLEIRTSNYEPNRRPRKSVKKAPSQMVLFNPEKKEEKKEEVKEREREEEKEEELIDEVNYHNALSFAERIRIKELIDTGISLKVVAKKIKRAKNTVTVEIRRNGGREVYDPKKAQLDAIARKKTAYNPLVEQGKQNLEKEIELESRIKSLEMQIGILITTIQAMRKNAQD